jgi:hypothetical protein
MNRSIRPSIAAALAACALLALLAGGAYGAGDVFHFQRESMAQFEKQLAKGEIHAATFNKVPHSLHLSMNDHRHLLVVYPPTEYKKIVAQLQAKGVPEAVEKHAQAAAKPAKHKLRYIAGGILVLVILVVLIVLLVGRRRELTEEQPEETGGQSSSAPPAESG